MQNCGHFSYRRAQCENYRISLTLFCKSFVKAMILLKKLLNSWFDEKKFSERGFLVFPHCENAISQKKFREINYLVTFFGNDDFTENCWFFRNNHDEFLLFHTLFRIPQSLFSCQCVNVGRTSDTSTHLTTFYALNCMNCCG